MFVGRKDDAREYAKSAAAQCTGDPMATARAIVVEAATSPDPLTAIDKYEAAAQALLQHSAPPPGDDDEPGSLEKV